MSTETHEILFKTNYTELKKAEAEYKAWAAKEIADNKIRASDAITTNKVIVEANKVKNTLLLRDDADARAKERELHKAWDAAILEDRKRTNAKMQQQSPELTGQTSELGSKQHINAVRQQLSKLAPGTEQYAKLDTHLKNLTASYNAARGSNSLFNRGLLETGENLVTITAGLYFAAAGVINMAKSFVTAFAEQERSMIQLTAVTGDNVEMRDRLIDSSTNLQNTFGIPDETIQSLQAFLVLQGRSEEQIGKTIEAARLLAIVQGTDIRDALMKVDQTFEGQIGRLGKLGSEFKNLTAEELENGVAADIIIQKYGKMGNIQDSTYTKTQKLGAAWSETKETLGGLLVDAVGPLITGLANLGLKGQDLVKIVGNAVLGLGTFTAAIKLTDKLSKDLITTFQNTASQLPLVGGFYNSISQYAMQYRDILYDLIGVQSQLSNGATFDNARGGNRGGVLAKELNANSGTIFKGSKNTSGTRQQEQQKELNYLEQLRKKISDLQTDIKSLETLQQQSDIKEHERLYLMDQKIAKQKELNELLRQGGLGALPNAMTLNNDPLNFRQAGITRNPRDAQITLQEELANLEAQRLEYAKSIGGEFVNMLNATGLMNTEFGRIVQMIQSVIGGISGGASLFSSIFGLVSSFIPGGSVIGGISGGGLKYGNMNPMTSSGGNSPVNIVLENVMDGQQFLVKQMPKYNTRRRISLA